jgi:hypothetical protein
MMKEEKPNKKSKDALNKKLTKLGLNLTDMTRGEIVEAVVTKCKGLKKAKV